MFAQSVFETFKKIHRAYLVFLSTIGIEHSATCFFQACKFSPTAGQKDKSQSVNYRAYEVIYQGGGWKTGLWIDWAQVKCGVGVQAYSIRFETSCEPSVVWQSRITYPKQEPIACNTVFSGIVQIGLVNLFTKSAKSMCNAMYCYEFSRVSRTHSMWITTSL